MANLTIPAGTKIAFRAGKTKDQAITDKIANQIANLNLCTTKELYINGERVGLTDAEATKLAGSASSGDLTALTNRVTAVEQKNTQQDKSINGLTTRVGTAEGTITTNKNNITSLTTRVGTAESNITSLTARVGTAEGTIKTHTSSISRLESEMSDNASYIAAVQTFITVPFDGFETGAVSIQAMGTIDPVAIVYVVQKKQFAAKDKSGSFYNAWTSSDGRNDTLYQTSPTAPHAKKLYVYNHEIYDIVTNRPVPLALMLGKPITVGATGQDDTRPISQKLFTQEIAKYVSLGTYNALAARVAALEAQLKLA